MDIQYCFGRTSIKISNTVLDVPQLREFLLFGIFIFSFACLREGYILVLGPGNMEGNMEMIR